MSVFECKHGLLCVGMWEGVFVGASWFVSVSVCLSVCVHVTACKCDSECLCACT